MQSSHVTTANRDYLENFPIGNWRVVNHAIFLSVHVILCSIPHIYTCPRALHHHLHHGGPACQVDTGPARNTQSFVSPWDVFMLVFSPHNFSSTRFFIEDVLCWFFPLTIFPLRGFLEGFFSWVCWPHILNKLFFIWPIPGEICVYTSQCNSTWWNVSLLCLMFISVCGSMFRCVGFISYFYSHCCCPTIPRRCCCPIIPNLSIVRYVILLHATAYHACIS